MGITSTATSSTYRLTVSDPADLTHPLQLDRQFDLVLSLEVAEHIPAGRAATFIDSLVRHGDAILFSAAIPRQGGEQHINCQWPSWWAELFTQRGYQTFDLVRPRASGTTMKSSGGTARTPSCTHAGPQRHDWPR